MKHKCLGEVGGMKDKCSAITKYLQYTVGHFASKRMIGRHLGWSGCNDGSEREALGSEVWET